MERLAEAILESLARNGHAAVVASPWCETGALKTGEKAGVVAVNSTGVHSVASKKYVVIAPGRGVIGSLKMIIRALDGV